MARKKEEIKVRENIDSTLDDIMSDRFGRYSKYIIQDRALPDARDGLKPVQRRILYAMHYDGNSFDKPHRKSAKTVGLVIGTFHPHGDTAVYDAMVRLSQDWKINLPLVDMHGNNGSIDDDPAAASRYTEARLSKNASFLLEDIDKETVQMVYNYDDTVLEPTVLPARYPLLLVNGCTGIASGYATNIAPHNLNEIVNATIYRITNPYCTLDDLMTFVKGPDFPTGGIVQGIENIKEVFKTGKGKVILRSKCEIVENKLNNQIIITEIPYEVVKCQLVKKIADVYLNKDVDGITDVRDESGRDGLRIVIDLKKEANAQLILNYLYKNTELQINYSYNNIAIVNRRPQLMSLQSALDCFIEHRRQVVLNRSVFLLEKKKYRLHIIEGLIKAISILDAIIETIRKSKDKKDSKDKLIEKFNFTEDQAEAIVSLQLYRLSNTDITKLKDEYATLNKEMNELNAIINSPKVLDNVLIKELKEVNELSPTPRKTKIEDEVEEISFDRMQMINNEQCYIALSKDGYLKRFSPRAYQANENQIPYTKENDYLIGIKSCDTLDTLLIFTSRGNYAYLPVYKIDECKFKDLGKHISTYVKMEGQENIVGAVLVKNFNTYAYIVTVSKKGMIKKSLLPRWNVERFSKALTAMKLRDNDELVGVCVCYAEDDLLIVNADGYYNYYSSEIISDVAPKSLGVGAINAKNSDVVGVIANHHNGNAIIIGSDKSGFKRVHFEELSFTSRNTKGERIFKQIKTNPHQIKYVKEIGSYYTLLINNGDLLTIPASEIPFMSPESTFSSSLVLNNGYSFIYDNHTDIETVDIVDLPKDYDLNEESYDQTNLF